MSEFEIENACEYEETVLEVTRATMEDVIAPHPDFGNMTASEQERIRQWALILVEAGFQTAMGLRRAKTHHRSALMANTALFLDQTVGLTSISDDKAGILQ